VLCGRLLGQRGGQGQDECQCFHGDYCNVAGEWRADFGPRGA
jgi:hypothetical protein